MLLKTLVEPINWNIKKGCIYINGYRNLVVQPQHLDMVPFIIINIMIMIMLMMIIIIVIIWKGYFSVNPIVSFCSFESKKRVVVHVVVAAKHL